ncbi:MAG: polysaccharide biosynthesis tyrosine autokinase [Deltaproteobacteria bacterium]|nr:polysaccharide biosynthesis tyrosine autokinase [Deltaproteobacteria bacterium]
MEDTSKTAEIAATLRTFLGVLEKWKWLAIGVLVSTVGLTALVTSRQVPEYRATAAVIIDRRSPTVLSRVQEVIELGSSDYWSIKEYMQTQHEILKSRRLAKRVVDKLTLALDERFLGLDRVTPPLNEAEMRVRMARMDPVAVLMSRISVEQRQDSQLVLVSVEDSDPARAQELANALVTEFREENLEYKKRVVNEAIAELRSMLVRLRQQKEDAEGRVLEFERRHNMLSLDSRRTQVANNLRLLNEQYVVAQIARSDVETSRIREELAQRISGAEEVLKKGNFQSAAHPVLVDSSQLASLKLKLVDLENNVRETSARYLDKHPVMQAAVSQRALVRKAIEVEARSLLKAELTRLQDSLSQENNRLRKAIEMEEELRRQLAAAREEEAALAKLELDYQPIKKRMDESRQTYEDVKNRYSETMLSAQVETNNVRVQDLAAEPNQPVRPNVKLNLLLGFLVGIALAIGACYFVESLDSTLKTREDVEAIPGVQFLGLIPAIDDLEQPESGVVEHDAPELFVHRMPKSSVSEHFRTAKTNLFFSRPTGRPTRILVTSPGPKEGKTTVGVNLAASAALAGTRTLVVDTDMRRPRVHKLLGIPRRPGMTEFFMGDHSVLKYVRPTRVPGLDVLTCGALSPNPLEIIESKRFAQMADALSQEYDLLVFDSPPLLAVADAKIISSLVDMAVLVVRAGRTSREAMREAREMLLPVKPDDVGVILNCFDIEKHSYRYHYYRSKTYAYYNYYSYDEKPGGPEATSAGDGKESGQWGKRSA